MLPRPPFNIPDSKHKTAWTGWTPASMGWALSALAGREAHAFLVVCPLEEDALRLLGDTKFFCEQLGIPSNPLWLHYPARPSDLLPTQWSEPRISRERLTALYHLLSPSRPTFIFCSFQAYVQLTLPVEIFMDRTYSARVGDTLVRDEWIVNLIHGGYEQEGVVEEPGSFAVRGGIFDVFSPHAPHAVRIELHGDTIESIRTFDSQSQRSLEKLSEMSWIPCREILWTPEQTPALLSRLKKLADDRDIPRTARAPLEECLSSGRYTPAFDSLLPLFYASHASLGDYTSQAQTILIDPFGLRREKVEMQDRWHRVDSGSLITCRPNDLSLPLDKAMEVLEKSSNLILSDIALEQEEQSFELAHVDIVPHTDLRIHYKGTSAHSPLTPVVQKIREWLDLGFDVSIVASMPEEAKHLQTLFEPHFQSAGSKVPQFLAGDLSSGFRCDAARAVWIAEHDLFGERKRTIVREVSREEAFSSLAELAEGNAVVHIDHGVAIYRGLQRIRLSRVENDFLVLEYASADKLYLPVYRLNRIHRYIGADGAKAHLDRLGNASTWEKTQEKAKRAVAQMAHELVQLYAARKIAQRDPMGRPDESYIAFESDFPFDETADQLHAIEDVSKDLENEKPMDRLICGDVGFGKTEVALRAAFRTAMAGQQIAVLVPTTVLAQQHYETFKARMKDYPLRVDFLSRFKSAREQKEGIRAIQEGKIDVVIGTHRLLSKDVSFQNLGLLIIDEEHRFGVKHKEAIKKFRNKVDVLTLTATPIPRTLQMSMAGIRDLSVINTPPLDRKSIQTYLCRFDDSVIRGAILKELERKGQVFFVHNRVETIDAMHSHLKKLVPEARIIVGHGQMSEKALEATMFRFLRHEFDVLLCTTIIESGLDVTNANTMIINKAHSFGLAQLYQLRGRVGRSDRPAYAYLLIPGEELISRDAQKRLKVLKRFTELGSGLKIALHDLEIRGAGNLLGASQSGHIAAVGFELYTQLLEREVRRLKGEKIEEEIEPEITCDFPAFLPEEYVPSTSERLVLYKRLSSIRSMEEMDSLRAEWIDRFGPLPPPAENLFRIIDLKILARKVGAVSLKLAGDRPAIEFCDRAAVHLDRLLNLVKKDRRLALRPDYKMTLDLQREHDPVDETRKILTAITE